MRSYLKTEQACGSVQPTAALLTYFLMNISVDPANVVSLFSHIRSSQNKSHLGNMVGQQ